MAKKNVIGGIEKSLKFYLEPIKFKSHHKINQMSNEQFEEKATECQIYRCKVAPHDAIIK